MRRSVLRWRLVLQCFVPPMMALLGLWSALAAEQLPAQATPPASSSEQRVAAAVDSEVSLPFPAEVVEPLPETLEALDAADLGAKETVLPKTRSHTNKGGGGRWYKSIEAHLIGFYSREGMLGLPEGDESPDHFNSSYRPPKNSLGLEVLYFFGEETRWHLGPMFFRTMDLHLQAAYDPRPKETGDRIRVIAGDAWMRLQPRHHSRMSLRIGHFLIPYGLNPVISPRGRFFLPAEGTDLGFKRDWGIEWRGPISEKLDFVLAATLGMGEGFHDPALRDPFRRSYLLSGRIGSATLMSFQWGLSGAFGRLPTLMYERKFSDLSRERWRIGLDMFRRFSANTVAAAEVFFGQDRPFPTPCGVEDSMKLGSPTPPDMSSSGGTAEVLGAMGQVMWAPEWHQNLGLGAQALALARNLDTDDPWMLALTLEAEYSLTNNLSVRLDFVHDFLKPPMAGNEDDQIFLALYYYGWGW